MSAAFFFVLGSAFIASLAASRLMVKAGVSDIPVGRSNHDSPVPTAGGIGVICGIGAGGLALSFPLGSGAALPELPSILSLGFMVGLTGLYDDLYTPPTEVKFGIFIAVAALLIYVLGPIQLLMLGPLTLSLPLWFGILGTLLWIFVVTNSVNFMDGANGFMPGCLLIAFAGLAALATKLQAPQSFWLAAICAAAWAGFLPWNARRKALVFAGDVGALLAGFLFAAAILLMLREADMAGAVYLGPLLLLPFLADVLLTLLWRLKRRQNLLRPHRDHLYQRAIRHGMSHRRISMIYYAAFLLCATAAYLAAGRSGAFIFWVFAAMTAMSILAYMIGHLFWRLRALS